MKPSDFDKLVIDRFNACRNVLCNKDKEYSSEKDRFHNFVIAGRMRNITPIKALDGMKLKHDVSIVDIIELMEKDHNYVPSEELVNEKITDEINYHLLLEGLITDRRNKLK